MPPRSLRAKTLRACLYLRISQDSTGEGLGVERQEAECRALCERRNWAVADVITENNRSATKGRRPGFDRLLELIASHEIDVIVIWAIDRLTRQIIEMEEIINACEMHGVKLATVCGDLDLSTVDGRQNARILASVARAEIERKSQRAASKFQQSAEAGKPSGGVRAFGYTKDGLHLEPEEAALVAEAYDRFNSGATLGEICRLFNERNASTARGNTWKTSSMRALLLNPRNAALRGVRWLARDEDGRPVLNEHGQQQRSQFHEIVGKAVWPAAVDEAVWRAAVSKLKDPVRRKHYKGCTRKHLLSGIAVCAVDGCGLVLRNKTNNKSRNLFCPALTHVCRRADAVEDFVEAVILERLRQPDAIDLVQVRAQGVDLAALRDEGAAMRERLRDMARLEALGQRTRDEVEAARDAVNERLGEIDRIVTDAGRADIVARFVGTGRDPVEVWEDPGTTLAMRQALITTLATIRVGSGRNGRPPKYSADEPPPRVFVDFRKREAQS
ncbi:recombinase family protein [Lentzea flaviverrucosa]|uniref:Site-specific DNA recombinase n=1 Tax=Lentzea flaviverrucosa TaxID=200379 RepID=A0A1H9XQ38_9PSEU|nr:recombinase family protein [Lentzea flaviverrucosa]RDI19677.1 DNA invertase Pin-like site-specific DNA recombinase [Lentzea flaviverrucosa]SES47803.1 Site-specific DNA recombinase [Lentzea flaviverrucosa]